MATENSENPNVEDLPPQHQQGFIGIMERNGNYYLGFRVSELGVPVLGSP